MRSGALLTCVVVWVLASPSHAAEAPVIEHRTASKHPMQYDVSRPVGWKLGGSYPVVVVIPDATRAFRSNLEQFVAARKNEPFILVAPQVLTSGGSSVPHEAYTYDAKTWAAIGEGSPFSFDEAGLEAVLADVTSRDGGQPKVFLTGWEAGGHTVWALLFRHPERFRAVAPVSTNYQGRWLEGSNAKGTKVPIKVFFCGVLEGTDELGRHAWFKQTREAMQVATTRGFAPPAFEELTGRAHGPLADAVLGYFASVLAAK